MKQEPLYSKERSFIYVYFVSRRTVLNTMRFKSVDRVPFYIGSPWNATLKRWYSEGLPENIDLRMLFDTDGIVELGIYFGMCPAFERTVLEENDTFVVYMNHFIQTEILCP